MFNPLRTFEPTGQWDFGQAPLHGERVYSWTARHKEDTRNIHLIAAKWLGCGQS
ncbi:hypothetical protein RRSWK_00022 [Rhodopirellula sp. SWK7]|nr:hypothetical protein RRSWK_00022 [Rhodopirellula sp. SWK7]